MQKELFPRETGVAVKNEDADDADEDMEEKKDSVNTPTAKKGLSNVPRTPTPFKNALNEIRKIHGQPYVPSSPNGLVEDITEIMNEEAQQDSTMDSTYDADSNVLTSVHHQTVNESSITANTNINTNVQNVTNPKRLTYEEDDSQNQNQTHPQQLQKKAKKSLESSWSTAANTTTNTTMTTATDDSDDFPYLVETPVCVCLYFLFIVCFKKEKKKKILKDTIFALLCLDNFYEISVEQGAKFEFGCSILTAQHCKRHTW